MSPQSSTPDAEDASLQPPVAAENTCKTSQTLLPTAGSIQQPNNTRNTVLQSIAAFQHSYSAFQHSSSVSNDEQNSSRPSSKPEEAVALVCTLSALLYDDDLRCLQTCVVYT